MVPAQPELVDAFRSVRHRSIGEKVFTGRAGEPLSPQNHSPVDFGRDHRVPTGTGVKGLPRHYLRHSRARQWLQSGLKVNGVSAWLGHSTVPGCQGTPLRLPGRVRTLTQCPTARRSSRTSPAPQALPLLSHGRRRYPCKHRYANAPIALRKRTPPRTIFRWFALQLPAMRRL